MAVTITAVPEKISRADYTRLVESVGLVADDLLSLTFSPRSITAEVLAYNSAGSVFADGAHIATHSISIPVED